MPLSYLAAEASGCYFIRGGDQGGSFCAPLLKEQLLSSHGPCPWPGTGAGGEEVTLHPHGSKAVANQTSEVPLPG